MVQEVEKSEEKQESNKKISQSCGAWRGTEGESDDFTEWERFINTVCPGSRKRNEFPHTLYQEWNETFYYKNNTAIAIQAQGNFQGDGNVLKLAVVVVAQLQIYRSNQIVCLKWVNFVVSEL